MPQAVEQDLEYLQGFQTEPSVSGSSSTAILSSKKQAQREQQSVMKYNEDTTVNPVL